MCLRIIGTIHLIGRISTTLLILEDSPPSFRILYILSDLQPLLARARKITELINNISTAFILPLPPRAARRKRSTRHIQAYVDVC